MNCGDAPPAPASAVIIGTGLIGTSVALALRQHGTAVWLADADPASAKLAAGLGAGQLLPGQAGSGDQPAGVGGPPGGADIAVLAVPPAAVAPVLAQAQRRRLARCYTDVASVKELPLRGAAELGCDLTMFVGGHPMSGRERSGPAAARADLFTGRPWVICPAPQAKPACVLAVDRLARACGAIAVQMTAAEHDRWVALVSHAPHLVAAAMAAQCQQAPAAALSLAGPGLRDVIRIAEGDPDLWTEILAANAVPVREVIGAVARWLRSAADTLAGLADGKPDARERLTAMLDAGRIGAGRVPGKHGRPAPDYVVVQVVIGDEPGELARVFTAAGEAGINVEDVRIEHSPGLPVGVAELYVRQDAAGRLAVALAARGWPVASPP